MRELIITESGASSSILIPNDRESYWLLVVTGGIDESTNLTLEASIDNATWFNVKENGENVVFAAPGAMLVSAGLYYRLNVGIYTTQIKFNAKPT